MLATEVNLPYVVAVSPAQLSYVLPAAMAVYGNDSLILSLEDSDGIVVFEPELSTHYTVTKSVTGTVTITFLSAAELLDGRWLVVDRRTPRTQGVRFSELQELPGAAIEGAADRAIAIAQELSEKISRALLARRGESLPPYPAKSQMIGKLFWLNDAGTGYEALPGASFAALAADIALGDESAVLQVRDILAQIEQLADIDAELVALAQQLSALVALATNLPELLNVDVSAAAAETSADAAEAARLAAEAAQGNAESAAAGSGVSAFYDTKAALTAALGSHTDGQVAQVFADESQGNRRAIYRRVSGAWVLKLVLDPAPPVYVDSISGNDANSGRTFSAPVQTLAAAIARLAEGSTLYLARGSVWYEAFAPTVKDLKVRAYGQGLRPVLDGAILASGSWTQHGTYTNLWYLDVNFSAATTGNFATIPSSAWHPAMWDEDDDTRVEEVALTRVLNGDVVGGSTVAAAAINDLLAIANAEPGRFTVHKTGSTGVEPRNTSENGTQFRFYIHPADGSNPNTNGRTVRVVAQRQHVTLPAGCDIEDLIVRRTGTKDLIGVAGGAVKPSRLMRVDMLEAAVHATVLGGVEFRHCFARSTDSHDDSRRQGGGAFHNFRAQTTDGTSPGFKVFDCEAERFAQAIYSHGDGGLSDEHVTFDIDGLKVTNCNSIINCDWVTKGVRARRIFARDVVTIVAHGPGTGGIEIEDSQIFFRDGSDEAGRRNIFIVYDNAASMTLRRCLVFCPETVAAQLQLTDAFPLGTVASANYPTIILENSTVIGPIKDPGNTARRQQHLVAKDSIVTEFWDVSASLAAIIAGDVVAENSYLGMQRTSLADLQVLHSGVEDDCITGVHSQVFERVVEAGDMAFYATSRTATFVDATDDNGDGTADILLNFNDGFYGRYIRIIDAYGSGLHYEGRITNKGTNGSSQKIIVTPVPSSDFSGKVLARGMFGIEIFGEDMEESATIDDDGIAIGVADGGMYTEGMLIHLGAIAPRGQPYGVREIQSISGNILTLDRPAEWLSASVQSHVNDLAGSKTNRGPLPIVPLSWGFPIILRDTSSQANTNKPLMTVTLAETGTVTARQSQSTGLFADLSGATAAGMSSVSLTYMTDGTARSYYAIDPVKGKLLAGLPVAVGDTLRIDCNVLVDEWRPRFASDPALSADAALEAGHLLAKRGMGYRRMVNG